MDRNDPPKPPATKISPHRPSIRLTGTEQSEHDALAELFLGDAPFAPAPMDLRGPVAVGPGVPPAASRSTGEPERGRFEGTAVRAASHTPADEPEEGRPLVELVILGHLPVRASLWVRQYACLSARKRNETVALVRAAGGSVAIDVITGRDTAQIEAVDDVETGVTIARHAAARVVLRVDETAEPELLERAGLDEVTILTGADEAAVVASYRLIKTLAASLDDRLDPECGPRLRVAVMGNPGPEIEAARQKIAKACKAFLDRPIEILDAWGRIDATGTVTVCRSDEAGAAEHALGVLLGGIAADAGGPNAAAAPAGLRLTEAPTEESLPSEAEVVVMPRQAQSVAHAVAGLGVPAAERTEQADRIIETRITRLREPLACLVEGLRPIEARCPSAPGVELACDDEGRLHAVATDDQGAGHAVAALLTASAWARANLALLIRAESGVAMPSADPRDDHATPLHLLARRPSAARAVLDTEVIVYALASVIAGGEEIMVATPLNDDPA
jgi:hypothetical protein